MIKDQGSLPLTFDVQSSPHAVRDALEAIETGLACFHFDPEEMSSVKLVLAEALNNIVEHAFAPPRPPGQIEVNCEMGDNGLQFLIVDNGGEMPNGQLPLGVSHNLDVDMMDLPEGGFGWFMIRELAKDLDYERVDGLNKLRVRVAVHPNV